MELDVPQALNTLRQQNQTLLEQLRYRQSTMKNLLGTLSSNLNNGTFSQSKTFAPENELKISRAEEFDFPPVNRDQQNSAKVHLYRKLNESNTSNNTYTSQNSDLNVTNLSRDNDNVRPTKENKNVDEAIQSILKRRKIIEDNVRVGSDRPTTPTMDSRRNLNFSYSDVAEDDLDMLKKVIRNQLEIDVAVEDQARKSKEKQEVEELLRQRQLHDSGNDRKHASVIRELSTRPKSVIFDETAPQERDRFYSSLLNGTHTRATMSQREGEQPLLGYDFIAGLLDNESKLVDKSDAFYDELNEFRRVNKDECTGKGPIANVLDLTRPISPEIKDPGHTCVHGYNINNRLYPEPLNEDPDGRSVCPVCLASRKDPTEEEPSYVRVSIPRSTLQAPYKIKPHRRRSFDDTDNFALGKHCLAGWECSKPSMLPTASTVDLKQAADGLKAKLTTTIQDIDAITESYKRIQRPETLLDTSRAIRAEAQFNAMSRTINPLHSTAF